MAPPWSARLCARCAPTPSLPPLAQRGDEGAQRGEGLLCAMPRTLVQGWDIITRAQRISTERYPVHLSCVASLIHLYSLSYSSSYGYIRLYTLPIRAAKWDK